MKLAKIIGCPKFFLTNEDIHTQTDLFIKKLNGILFKCFKKIRIGKKKISEYESLYDKWTSIRHNDDEASKLKSADLEEELADNYADNIHEKIREEIEGLECEEGGLNSGRLWKLKRKLFSKFNDPPSAIKDKNGKLLTSKDDILDATLQHYQKVLENRKIKEGLEDHQKEREELAKVRMKQCKENKTPDWDLQDLEEALKNLKKDKASDALGYINELFRPETLGSDLKLALLNLLNKIKQEQIFPHALEACNITSIFKNKGSKADLNNYRGIFRVMIFRLILERLISNDEYSTIDQNLTDANVGARKKRNIRDNLFVIYAVMNYVKKGVKETVDVCAEKSREVF